jgi:flagella basal body P-ring formation protein FlgA
MMSSIKVGISILLAGLFATVGLAQESSTGRGEASRTVTIRGRQYSTVTASGVRLSDVADVTSERLKDDEAVIGLKKISLDKSPAPGKELTLSAATVLERIKAEGVNLDQVGYVFPRVMVVRRAGRLVSTAEVRSAIEEYLGESGRDVEIRNLNFSEDQYVTPGIIKFEVSSYNTLRGGELGFEIRARDENNEIVKFNVTASVEEWKQMPVANRSLGRGSIVGPEDVVMARMNLAGLPGDVARDPKQVLGFEASREIAVGQVFRQNNLAIPPVIDSGAKVILRYKSALMEATATGVSLEAGIKGQQIRIKNDGSGKVVYGTVVEPGLADVRLMEVK